MKQQFRTRAKAVATRVAPGVMNAPELLVALRGRTDVLEKRSDRQARRLAELEAEVQELRRLHNRLAELTDIVQELLIPAATRDEERLATLLSDYSDKL